MKKEIFRPKGMKQFVGPVVPVTTAGGFAFISGQISVIPETGEVSKGTIEEETRQVLSTIKMIVEELGATLDDVVKCDVFLLTMKDFEGMNAVYAEFFGTDCPPARCTVAVELWGEMKVEIGALVKL